MNQQMTLQVEGLRFNPQPYWCILKIQASISGKPGTLIYNKDLSIYIHHPSRELAESLLCDELKGYFKARVHGKKIEIFNKVNYKDW